ncbi:MAG: hypothetical protein GY856_33300 [bacterium]|nr:hypothetical protein [bacterium]
MTEATDDSWTAVRLAMPGPRRARAVKTLGIASYYAEAYGDAIKWLTEAVDTLDPDLKHEYTAALGSFAAALAMSTDDDARWALRICAQARARLKGRHKMQRAKLWWIEGLLHHRLGDDVEAWQALDIARRSLIALRVAPEVAAITADMARISPQPRAIRHLCHEAGKVIVASHPLAEPLRAVASAAQEAIPAAAAALRKAASGLALCPSLWSRDPGSACRCPTPPGM